MIQLTGILKISLHNKDTKSEGLFATLQTDEQEYLLYKKGCFPQDIEQFSAYTDKQVLIEGELEQTGYLAVEKIQLQPTPDKNNKEGNNQ